MTSASPVPSLRDLGAATTPSTQGRRYSTHTPVNAATPKSSSAASSASEVKSPLFNATTIDDFAFNSRRFPGPAKARELVFLRDSLGRWLAHRRAHAEGALR